MSGTTKSTGDTKIPKIRFPEFGGDWNIKRLGEVFERITGKNTENNTNVLTISAQQGLINQEKFFTMSVSAKDVTGYIFLKKGDFAYNKSYSKGYPMGAIKKLKKYEKGVVSTLYICFRLKNDKNSEFFFEKYFDAGKLNKGIAKIAQEGARNHGLLNMSVGDFFSGILLTIPILSEQQKIADFLVAVDNWIENKKAQKEKLEAYKKGLMQKIFSREIRLKDENGKDFPEWDEKRLGEVAKFLKGKGISKVDIQEDGENKCIRYGELYTEYNEVISGIASRTKLAKEESVLSEKNDILIPSSGETPIDIATASCVNESEILLGGDLNILRFKKGNNGVFFAYYLSNYKSREIARMAQGNAVVHLYNSQLQTLKISLPSLPEQQKIADFLSSVDTLITAKQAEIEKAEQWKKGLMQGLFV